METNDSLVFGHGLARLKTGVVLVFFDALKNPQRYEPTFVVKESMRLNGLELFAPGEHPTAEKDLIDPNVSVKQKAAQILQQFKPVAKAIQTTNPEDFYGTLVELCDDAMTDYDRQSLSWDSDTLITAADVLPNRGIIEAMRETVLTPHRRRCQDLENHIGKLAADSVNLFVENNGS